MFIKKKSKKKIQSIILFNKYTIFLSRKTKKNENKKNKVIPNHLNVSQSFLIIIKNESFSLFAPEKFIWSMREISMDFEGKKSIELKNYKKMKFDNKLLFVETPSVFNIKNNNKKNNMNLNSSNILLKSKKTSKTDKENILNSNNSNFLNSNLTVDFVNIDSFTIEGINNNSYVFDNKKENQKLRIKNKNLNHLYNSYNKLYEFLPKIRSKSTKNNKTSQINNHLDLKNNLIIFDNQYENVKNDLIELNPILKNNPILREQFFVNASEGKEEKYQFYKNLYNIINNKSLKNKNVFENNYSPIKKNKFNGLNNKNLNFPLPSPLHTKMLKEVKEKNKNYINLSEINLKNKSLLTKSSSGINLRKKNIF